MYRLLFLALVATATAVWAQDTPSDDESETTPAAETISVDDLEDLDLDSQEDHTEEDEDVFKPTDVVSYSQSVAFPVDI